MNIPNRRELLVCLRSVLQADNLAPEGFALVEFEDYRLQNSALSTAHIRETAASVIAAAFRKDPGISWMATGHMEVASGPCDDNNHEAKQIEEFLAFLSQWEVFICHRKGLALLCIELQEREIVGVCCLLAPTAKQSLVDEVLGVFCIRSPFWGLFSPQQKRATAFASWQQESRTRACEGRLPLFLSMLGVRPDFHGRGIGKCLLQTVSLISLELDLPIYLETSVPRNVELYEHFGYQVLERLKRPVIVYDSRTHEKQEELDILTPMLRYPK
eukprot:jgi/Galph1/278/GphlegSOOS_G5088.1